MSNYYRNLAADQCAVWHAFALFACALADVVYEDRYGTPLQRHAVHVAQAATAAAVRGAA